MTKKQNTPTAETPAEVVVSAASKSMLSDADSILDESIDDAMTKDLNGDQAPSVTDQPSQQPQLPVDPNAAGGGGLQQVAPLPGQQPIQPQIPGQQPQQIAEPSTFEEFAVQNGFDKRDLNDPLKLAKAYKSLEAEYSRNNQNFMALRSMMMMNPATSAAAGINPIINQQQIPTVPYPQQPMMPQQQQYIPNQQMQPQQQFQQQPQQPEPPKQMTQAEIQALNDEWVDNPAGAVNKMLSNLNFMTKNDYTQEVQNREYQQQVQEQQSIQTQNKVDAIISTLPNYDQYRGTMLNLYQMNPNYRSLAPEHSLPMLYQAAVALTAGQQQNPAQQQPQQQQQQFAQVPTQQTNPAQAMNIALANTNSGGGPSGGINPDGNELANVDWNSMSASQIERAIGYKERF